MKTKIPTNLPKQINVLGIIYQICYVEHASEADFEQRQALWGQIDYWTRIIRVYIKDRTIEDIWVTLLHEILHAISNQMNLALEDKGEDSDNGETVTVDLLSYALYDTLTRNGLMKI